MARIWIKSIGVFFSIALVIDSGQIVSAAALAYDAADDPAYFVSGIGAWGSGDNGGSGFGPWSISTGPEYSGQFIWTSANNAGGFSLGIPSGNIDTNGWAWGLYANFGETIGATRPFTGGPLVAGQKLQLDMDNGWVQDLSVVGFGLQNANGVNRLEFMFVGGRLNYTLIVDGLESQTEIPFTGDGLHVEFTMLEGNGYSLAITPAGGAAATFSGLLLDTDIDRLRLFNYAGGAGSDYDLYFNSLAISNVPEPAGAALLLIMSALGLRRMRRAMSQSR